MKPKTKKRLGVGILCAALLLFLGAVWADSGIRAMLGVLAVLVFLGAAAVGTWLIATGNTEEDDDDV